MQVTAKIWVRCFNFFPHLIQVHWMLLLYAYSNWKKQSRSSWEQSQLKVVQVPFHRFCVSDEDILFYTRFTSREVFCDFLEAIQPSVSVLVYWSKAQKKKQTFEPISTSPTRWVFSLLLPGCCRPAREGAGWHVSGQFVHCLACCYNVGQLPLPAPWLPPLLLGSLPIWMSKQQVKNTMPS